MSEKLRESLSAVVDDEADEFELRRVLDELAKDPALKASWERYHMIGTVLRGEYATNADGLRERVWQDLSIDSVADTRTQQPEPPETSTASEGGKSRVNRWRSLAAAAGVVIVVAVGVGNLDLSEEQPEIAMQGSSTGSGARDVQTVLKGAVELKEVVTPLDLHRTEAYKVAHSQQRGMISPGPEAFAKMVSYQRR